MSDNIASPTPDEKDYKGTMTKKEYDKQPESNTGATVERDVDAPDAKLTPVAPPDPITTYKEEAFGEDATLNDEQKDQLRKKREILDAEKNNPPEQQVIAQPVPVPQDVQEKHAERVTHEQREKLDSRPKASSQKK